MKTLAAALLLALSPLPLMGTAHASALGTRTPALAPDDGTKGGDDDSKGGDDEGSEEEYRSRRAGPFAR
ncbi:hypothetical protein P2318_04895 [Myxococcaceae bacterium GXIMD 01537]